MPLQAAPAKTISTRRGVKHAFAAGTDIRTNSVRYVAARKPAFRARSNSPKDSEATPTYILQRSFDLENWTDVNSVPAPANTFDMTDPAAHGRAMYRVRAK
jgi:hypothetical protein